jgi:hypothetical protein
LRGLSFRSYQIMQLNIVTSYEIFRSQRKCFWHMQYTTV